MDLSTVRTVVQLWKEYIREQDVSVHDTEVCYDDDAVAIRLKLGFCWDRPRDSYPEVEVQWVGDTVRVSGILLEFDIITLDVGGLEPSKIAQLFEPAILARIESLRQQAASAEKEIIALDGNDLKMLGAIVGRHLDVVARNGGPTFAFSCRASWRGDSPPFDGQKVWVQDQKGAFRPAHLRLHPRYERPRGRQGEQIYAVHITADRPVFDGSTVLEGNPAEVRHETNDMAAILPRSAATDLLMAAIARTSENTRRLHDRLLAVTEAFAAASLKLIAAAPDPSPRTLLGSDSDSGNAADKGPAKA
jgi:hypothetical protein